MFSTIGIVIDIALVALFMILGIIGLKKGLLKSVISLFSWGACLIVAIFSAKLVAGWINGIYNFAGLIGGKITKSLQSLNAFFTLPINSFANTQEIVKNIPIDLNGLLKQLVKVVFSNNSVDMSSADSLGHITGISLGQICMVIISGILIFVVLMIVVKLLSKLFDNIEKTKILGSLNKVLGLCLGLIKAGLIVFVINVVLVGISLMPVANKIITPLIKESTYVEKFIYNKTDDLFGKYVIEGDLVKNWVTDLWNSR